MNYPRLYVFKTYLVTATSLTTNGLTLGSDYFSIRIPQMVPRELQGKVTVTHFPTNTGQIFRWKQLKKNTLRFNGFIKEDTMGSTVTVKVAIEQYLMNRMKYTVTTAEALAIQYDSGVYDKFGGASGSAMTVARGALEMVAPQWSGDENLGFTVNGVFHIVWS